MADDLSETTEQVASNVINRRIISARSAFDEWLKDVDKDIPIDIPDGILSVFIPKRLYELSGDPNNLEVIPANLEGNHQIGFSIVERGVGGLTDRKIWNEHIERVDKEEVQGGKAPDGIDEMHWAYRKSVKNGKISLEDKILLSVLLKDSPRKPGKQLRVGSYEDREELRGSGVATSFYENLSVIAKALGYRFLSGFNDERNVGFFIQKLGRVTANQIRDEHRDDFILGGEGFGDVYTIQFLYPEDKVKYCVEGTQ